MREGKHEAHTYDAETERLKAEYELEKQKMKNLKYEQRQESKERFRGKSLKSKLLILLLIVIVVIAGSIVIPGIIVKPKITNDTHAELIKVLEISELSAAKINYDGVYEKKNDKGKIKYYVKYQAIVKASFDVSKIKVDAQPLSKKLVITIPKLELKPTLNDKEMDYIPSNTKGSYKEDRIGCKKDAEKEVRNNSTIEDIAYNNVDSMIEGIVHPFVDEYGYKIEIIHSKEADSNEK